MATSDRAIQWIGGLIVAAGVAVAAMRFGGGTPPEESLEGALGSCALGAAVAAPGVLATLAVRGRRPVLLLPAAVVLAPLSLLSFAGVLLPLLIPAVLLLRAHGERSSEDPMSLARTMVMLATVVVLLLAAVAALLVHPDPRSYTTPGGGGSTSDVITYAEALVSLALTGGAIAAGWYLALGPIRRQRFG